MGDKIKGYIDTLQIEPKPLSTKATTPVVDIPTVEDPFEKPEKTSKPKSKAPSKKTSRTQSKGEFTTTQKSIDIIEKNIDKEDIVNFIKFITKNKLILMILN